MNLSSFRVLAAAAAALSGLAGAVAACTSSTPGSPSPVTTTATTPVPTASGPASPPADAATQSSVSCRTILAAKPGTPSGVQSVDLDGDGPLPALQLYCDMTFDGGGWTLIQAYTGANTPADLLDASPGDSGILVAPPRPGTFGALDGWAVKLLAAQSTQAHIRYSFAADASAADPDAGVWVTSLPPTPDAGPTLPLANLQKLRVLSDDSDGGFDAWTGPQANATELAWPPTCIDADPLSRAYPSIYRACGNPDAMNIIAGLSGRVSWLWRNTSQRDPIEVYVR